MDKGLIFTYLCTYGGAALSLFDPWIGLLIYVCFAIIKPESLWYWSVPAGNYSRIIAIALLVGWALHGCGNWKLGRARGIALALVGFLGWNVLSALQAVQPAVAWPAVEALAKIVLPFVVGLSLIRSVRQLKQLAWVICVSHGYLAYDFNMSYYGGFNKVLDVGFAGMDNNCIAITMVTCAGLAFFLGLHEQVWWRKLLAWAMAALMAHVVLFSFSRGGMLGLVLTGLVSFLLIPKQPRHYWIFAAAIALCLRLAGPEVVKRFDSAFADQQQRDASAESRLELWNICMNVMEDKPLFGLGPHHFPVYAQSFGLTRGKEAHSTWMQTGAELGVPGLALLVAFYALCARRLWTLARRGEHGVDPWFSDSSRMVVASLAGFVVSAQFVSLTGLEAPYYIVLLGAGTLVLTTSAKASKSRTEVPAGEAASLQAEDRQLVATAEATRTR